ncbi:hypothetical protein [Oleiharenicola lentus]|uniref:hypothetical protein n=1 Tax=Oleiharenicola lentus TaxID=2508720 RepID=UPI003F676E06
MRILLLVLGGLMMLAAMAISVFMLGVIAHGPNAEKFALWSKILSVSLFSLPVAWVCGFIFSGREIADKNRPNIVRQLLNLPFYAVSVHGLMWLAAIFFGMR